MLSWCGGSAGSCAGWLRQRRSWLTVVSGAADAVAGAEEVEADASGGLEIEIEIEVEADASGALAADLERSGTVQAQGHIMLSSHQHSVTMSTPGSLAQICS